MAKARILVVEDEAIIAMEIENSLQNLGYEVTSVVNMGDKAVEKAETDRPDLILMDIRIQGDKDGIETVEIIRNKFSIPVVFSTAYLDEERIERAKITMPFGYVLKPIQERDLRVTLEMALYVANVDAERRKTEERLKEKEQFQQVLMDSIPSPVFYKDIHGVYLGCNKAFEDYLGKPKDEIVDHSTFDLSPSDLAEIYHKKDLELFREPGTQIYESQVVYSDGTKHDVMFQKASFHNSNGDIGGLVGVILDITKRKEAEKAQIEAEKELTITLNATTEGIWKWNFKTDELFFSDQYYTMLGYELGAFPSNFESWVSLIHPEDRDKALEVANEYLKTKPDLYENSFRLKTANGDYRWVRTRAKVVERDESGAAVRMIGNHEDITHQKQAEESLEKIEWLLEKSVKDNEESVNRPYYGDVTELNSYQLIKGSMDVDVLHSIASDTIDLLETSVAVYEKNGDYAFGMFSSGWCQLMDSASRKLGNTDDNQEALTCGKWHCHENCWNDSAKVCIESGKPTDIKCVGGIHLYAEPIMANHEVIGSINIGYGNPPTDEQTLKTLSERFDTPIDDLRQAAEEYDSRPKYIIELAKKRLKTSAQLIGKMVESTLAQKKYKTLFDGASDAIFLADTQTGFIVDVNQRAEKLVGRDRNELIGMHQSHLHPQEIREQAKATFRSHFEKDNEDLVSGLTVVHKEGHTIPVEINPCIIDVNREKRVYGIFRDITDRKQAEEELRKSKQRLREAEQIADIGHWEMDIKTGDSTWSDQFFRICGLEPGTCKPTAELGFQIIHPDDRARAQIEVEKAIEQKGEYNLEKRIVRPDGSVRFVHSKGLIILDEHGQPAKLVGTFLDITDHKLIEKAIIDREERLRSFLNNSTDNIHIFDSNCVCKEVNNTVLERFNVKREDIIGKTLEELVPNVRETGRYEKYLEVMKSGTPMVFEDVLYQSIHHQVEMYLTVKAIKVGEGFAIITTDITDSVLTKKELERKSFELEERIKELGCLYRVSEIVNDYDLTLDETLQRIIDIIPESMRYPEITNVRITLKDREYLSKGSPLKPCDDEYWKILGDIISFNEKEGHLCICYPKKDNLPPLKEEEPFIKALAERIGKIMERFRAEEELKIKTNFLDKIIETSALSTWISDEKGTSIMTNPACLEFFGATEEEVIGKYNLFQDAVIEKNGFMPTIKEVFEKGKPASIIIDYDFKAVDHVDVKNATHKIINSIFTPMLDDHGKVTNVIVQAIDLTEIKKAEEKIQTSLKEKETLLQEIHHRVKNNLAVISGLLGLQSSKADDVNVKNTLLESKNRVNSMSMIHEVLYQSESLSQVDMDKYLSKLANDVSRNYQTSGHIQVVVEAEQIKIGAKMASPIGLIVNEMITNSFKYAFPEKQKGEIKIQLREIDNQFELTYSDDGIGIPANVDLNNTDSMGFRLIKILSEGQLKGSISINRDKGTCFTLRFDRER